MNTWHHVTHGLHAILFIIEIEMRQIVQKKNNNVKLLSNRAMVVNGHCNEFYKKVMLIEILSTIRELFNDVTVFYATHLPVDNEIYDYVDYVIYNKNNPIFNKDVYTQFSEHCYWWNSWVFKPEGNFRIMRNSQYHGYAHHILLNDATAVVHNQRIDYIHYVNYDVRLELLPTLEEHYNYMKVDDYDVVSYQFFKDGMGTEFFSAKTNVAYECICSVLTVEEYEKFGKAALESTYKMMFNGKKNKNLGFFQPEKGENINVGRLAFDFRETLGSVVPLNSNIDGVLVIPYEQNKIKRINVMNSHNKIVHVTMKQFDLYNEELKSDNFILGLNQWNELYPGPKTRYIKVFFNGKEKTFFDLENKFNWGKVETI